MKLALRYLFQDRDRHGNERLYVRRNGRKIRIKERWGAPEFLHAYRNVLPASLNAVPIHDYLHQKLSGPQGSTVQPSFSSRFPSVPAANAPGQGGESGTFDDEQNSEEVAQLSTRKPSKEGFFGVLTKRSGPFHYVLEGIARSRPRNEKREVTRLTASQSRMIWYARQRKKWRLRSGVISGTKWWRIITCDKDCVPS